MIFSNPQKRGAGLCFALVFTAALLSGCFGLGMYGKADMKHFKEIKEPAELKGKSKKDIIKTMGVPDSHVTVGKTEYWRFKNVSGFYVVVFGKAHVKDLILEFRGGNKVTSSYLVDKGNSIGVLGGPLISN
jgi:hypothetical protein